jgi:dTDP-4-dehydrorhamnose 3,5-epimerase
MDTGFILGGLKIINPDIYQDNRGWFIEEYNKQKYKELCDITCNFVQDNHSYSLAYGTIRGIHFQNSPMAQAKLVSCPRGTILDIAVDLRKNSPTYTKYLAIVLSEDNHKQLFIPRGFGHAFITLTDNTEVFYKVDNYYSKAHDRSIRDDDPIIKIEWPNINFILSEKDNNAPFLIDSDVNFEEETL